MSFLERAFLIATQVPDWLLILICLALLVYNFPRLVVRLLGQFIGGGSSDFIVGASDLRVDHEALAEALLEKSKPRGNWPIIFRVLNVIAVLLTVIVCTIQLLIWLEILDPETPFAATSGDSTSNPATEE